MSFGYCQHKFDANDSKKYQEQLNVEFADAKTSPLAPDDLAAFKTLDFYPITEKFCVIAKLIRTKDEKPFEMVTSTRRRPLYIKYGEVSFGIDGKTFTLKVYQSVDYSSQKGHEDDLFLPFFDLTCGKDSYIGGRYLDLIAPKDDKILIDFNKAYNPYCAYSHNYSCPKVPFENDLKIEIQAGVKKFED